MHGTGRPEIIALLQVILGLEMVVNKQWDGSGSVHERVLAHRFPSFYSAAYLDPLVNG